MTWEPPSPPQHHNDANCGQFQFVKTSLTAILATTLDILAGPVTVI